MEETLLNGRLIVKVGDLTEEKVDAIVNAANATLLGGGGVDGAIHRRGGPAILEECRRIRKTDYPDGLPTGKAVITTGGDLPARHVIHTVGPIYGQTSGRDAELLADCYSNSIRLAIENGLATIAFPSISTGVYHYPKHKAAAVAAAAIQAELDTADSPITVHLVFFSSADAQTFLKNAGL
jgi:O-acetyl-ADP-ribose deacetylase